MDWLNYHHLLYFWTVAREGSMAAASDKLQLAQPTLSTQIKRLEQSLDVALFDRSGRKLKLTDTGREVFRYADEIFALGRELVETVKGQHAGRPLRLHVGIADVLPKLVAHHLLEPALAMSDSLRVVCFEGKPERLLARLSLHELDVVLTDAPVSGDAHIRAFNHVLGECTVSIFGVARLCNRVRKGFPGSLNGMPLLLPTANTMLRRSLERWFEAADIRPQVVGEFEDSALLKVFGQSGIGLFPGPTVIADEIQRQYRVRLAGHVPEIKEQYYAVSLERRVKHPAVLAIARSAEKTMFGTKKR